MAVMVVIEVPQGTQEQYDNVFKNLGWRPVCRVTGDGSFTSPVPWTVALRAEPRRRRPSCSRTSCGRAEPPARG